MIDKDISFATKGLLMYLLSTQDYSDVKIYDALEKSKDSTTHLMKIVNEALRTGYLIKYRCKEGKVPRTRYKFSEKVLCKKQENA
jgi:hypothetical protein